MLRRIATAIARSRGDSEMSPSKAPVKSSRRFAKAFMIRTLTANSAECEAGTVSPRSRSNSRYSSAKPFQTNLLPKQPHHTLAAAVPHAPGLRSI